MYNDYYNKERIMNEISLLREELEIEKEKPIHERDKEKELKLLYKQFIKGLRLSTGNKIF